MLRKFVASILPKKQSLRPVFILGCGRSGTTILGRTLAEHPSVTYLNERRDLWYRAYPQTNIWPDKAAACGKMVLTAEDTEEARSIKLRRLFHAETLRTCRPVLVEKLPINNFRVEFINEIFPEARFIHIYRNGLEVARSIETLSERGHWFASNPYKWDQLTQLAGANPATRKLPEICNGFLLQGLLEWRLATESVVKFLAGSSPNRYLEISYARFTEEPVEIIRQVTSFIGIDDDDAVISFVQKNISRRTRSLNNMTPSRKELKIGGRLLPLSMNNACGGLSAASLPDSVAVDSES